MTYPNNTPDLIIDVHSPCLVTDRVSFTVLRLCAIIINTAPEPGTEGPRDLPRTLQNETSFVRSTSTREHLSRLSEDSRREFVVVLPPLLFGIVYGGSGGRKSSSSSGPSGTPLVSRPPCPRSRLSFEGSWGGRRLEAEPRGERALLLVERVREPALCTARGTKG